MFAPAAQSARLGPTVITARALAVAVAALFAIDAYVHFSDAHLYDFSAGASITQGSLFRVQASVAAAVALALLVRPHWLVWTVAVLVAASAAGAVYLYTYVDVGTLGPLPDMYEPTWALPGKRLAASAEIAATLTSVVGLVISLYVQRSARRASSTGKPPRDSRIRRRRRRRDAATDQPA
jgi:hypothetical protein